MILLCFTVLSTIDKHWGPKHLFYLLSNPDLSFYIYDCCSSAGLPGIC